MPIKFNGGRGAVICQRCSVIIDEDLNEEDYTYYKAHPEEHICMKCKDGEDKNEGTTMKTDCPDKDPVSCSDCTGVGCGKCKDTGWYQYDHNHSQVCDECCEHKEGWWDLTPIYHSYIEGEDNACCKAGCGTMRRDILDGTTGEVVDE